MQRAGGEGALEDLAPVLLGEAVQVAAPGTARGARRHVVAEVLLVVLLVLGLLAEELKLEESGKLVMV